LSITSIFIIQNQPPEAKEPSRRRPLELPKSTASLHSPQ
jgi:hypothetical protein